MKRFAHLRREDGQALVEFVLVLPILLMLATAITSFGLVFYRYITVTDAVRSAARTLSLGRNETTPDPCIAATSQAVNSAIDVNLQPSDVTTKVGTDPAQSQQTCPGTGSEWIQNSQVTVTATIPCSINIIGVDISCPGGQLTASATDAIE